MNAEVEQILESSVDICLAEQSLKLARMRTRWAACRDFYAPLISAFQRLGSEPYLQDDYVVGKLTGDKETLAKAFRILRGAGFTFSADRPKQGDSEWYTFFTHPDCQTKFFFNFTSSVCRRIKVGTKLVEQDVYETQCGDLSNALPAAEAPIMEVVTNESDIPF
jgi:hypothetical protein